MQKDIQPSCVTRLLEEIGLPQWANVKRLNNSICPALTTLIKPEHDRARLSSITLSKWVVALGELASKLPSTNAQDKEEMSKLLLEPVAAATISSELTNLDDLETIAGVHEHSGLFYQILLVVAETKHIIFSKIAVMINQLVSVMAIPPEQALLLALTRSRSLFTQQSWNNSYRINTDHFAHWISIVVSCAKEAAKDTTRGIQDWCARYVCRPLGEFLQSSAQTAIPLSQILSSIAQAKDFLALTQFPEADMTFELLLQTTPAAVMKQFGFQVPEPDGDMQTQPMLSEWISALIRAVRFLPFLRLCASLS